MPEIGIILDHLESVKSLRFGDFELFSGNYRINNSKVYISTAWSGWGKVSAAKLLQDYYHQVSQ